MKNPLLHFSIITSLLLGACKKDKNEVNQPPAEINEEELITSLLIHLYPFGNAGDTTTFAFRDLDGPGGLDPEPIDTIFLTANTTYGCFLSVLNESVVPTDDITPEIESEADEHLFCFDVVNAALTIVRTDTDGTYEVGLHSAWTTAAATGGDLQITLKHQPGIKNGSCDLGDTDIELSFPVVIQ
jgi:hypothetical protein